jgi:fatty acid desaturase
MQFSFVPHSFSSTKHTQVFVSTIKQREILIIFLAPSVLFTYCSFFILLFSYLNSEYFKNNKFLRNFENMIISSNTLRILTTYLGLLFIVVLFMLLFVVKVLKKLSG